MRHSGNIVSGQSFMKHYQRETVRRLDGKIITGKGEGLLFHVKGNFLRPVVGEYRAKWRIESCER